MTEETVSELEKLIETIAKNISKLKTPELQEKAILTLLSSIATMNTNSTIEPIGRLEQAKFYLIMRSWKPLEQLLRTKSDLPAKT